LRPQAEIYCVEPKGFDDTTRSLEAGENRANAPDARSICDALLAPEPGKLTFAINKRLLSGGLVVDDREVEAAMVYAANTLKLAVEPGGAVALAALLARRIDIQGQTVVAVLSGGNFDPKLLAQLLAEDFKSSD
jgi:threonine dehydratase